jgi:hypothetical protein
MGTWEHIKLGELPRHNTLGFVLLLGEIPQKNTYKIKREVVNEVPKFSITSLDFVSFHSD